MKTLKHKSQRVLVLFDVQNLYYSGMHIYNAKVNFKAILETAVAGRQLVKAIAYVIKTEIKDEKNFHEALNNIGIEVKAKDIQIFCTGDKKGDWDIGIAMDAVRHANKVDTVVLVSGDGDFKELLAYLKSHGCRTEIIAFSKTASKQLKEEADDFIDLCKNVKKYLIQRKKGSKSFSHKQRDYKKQNKGGNEKNSTSTNNNIKEPAMIANIVEPPAIKAKKAETSYFGDSNDKEKTGSANATAKQANSKEAFSSQKEEPLKQKAGAAKKPSAAKKRNETKAKADKSRAKEKNRLAKSKANADKAADKEKEQRESLKSKLKKLISAKKDGS